MNIVQVATGYTSVPARTSAATEILIEHLSKSLLKKKQNITLIDIRDDCRLDLPFRVVEVYMPRGFCAHDYTHNLGLKHKIKRVIYSFKLNRTVGRFSSSYHIDILHVHNQYNAALLFRRRDIPIVYTLHSYIWSQSWKEIEFLIRKKYFLETISFRKATKITVLNKCAADNLITKLGIDSHKIEVIPNGVDANLYFPIDTSLIQEQRRKYAADEEIVILHVGAFSDRKNQKFLLESLKPLFLKYKIKMLLIGQVVDSQYDKELRSYVICEKLQNKVQFIGCVPPGSDLNIFYNLSDILVFPSKSEAFPLVPLEAMSAGLPVVISKISSTADISKRPDDLVFFELGSSEDFVFKIEKLIVNETFRKDIGEKARKTIMDYYDWDIVATKYISLYDEALNAFSNRVNKFREN